MSLRNPEISRIRRRIQDRGPPVPSLPPEVKLVILNHLPFKDVKKSATLVDKAWGSAAKASMGERGTFILKARTLDEMLQLEEHKKMYVKTIKIVRPQKGSLPELTSKIINVLRNKVESGGSGVKHLIIGRLRSNSEEETTQFFEQLFSACPNVKHLSVPSDVHIQMMLFDRNLSFVRMLPVLKYCLCVEWFQEERDVLNPHPWFIMATPNVTRIIAPPELPRYLHDSNHWPKLQRIEHFRFRYPNDRSRIYTLPRTFDGWIRPLKVISFLVVPQFTTSEILKVMDAFSGTLEVFELQSCFFYGVKAIRERVHNYPTPVMPRLHTLSFVDAEPQDFSKVGFIFGDLLNPTFVERPMRLNAHLPALKSIRFTMRGGTANTMELAQSSIFLLNFFPILLDSNDLTAYPNMKTLELTWPDPDEDLELWKAWTRRVVSKFPNLQGNPHVDKWKELRCMDDENNDQRVDQVAIAWGNYQQRYEARRRNTPPRRRKPWW